MVRLSPRVHLVRADNPSPLTLSGTNTYILGSGDGSAVCIDPGPPMRAHIDAILTSLQRLKLRLEAIAVTHGHPDHAPGASMLSDATGACVYGHRLAQFARTAVLADGDLLQFGNGGLRALDTPGHTFDHLCYYFVQEAALFAGDVILGEGTVVIAPPGGAMRPYQATLRRLAKDFSQAHRIYGGHGPPIDDPAAKLQEYIDHRQLRENEIVGALGDAPQTIPQLVRRIYVNVNPVLWPAAARQILAYLIALQDEGRVRAIGAAQQPTAQEASLLSPSWDRIMDAQSAAVAQAELGAFLHIERVDVYELIR
ncbi:MAG: MBL fold metallo-hydrolase [Candidatus Eremiobacteraeota bacterium]|nr:MBL fold metallo-hydrolase [Candidatus Eremiobacteraeota bacterium]